MEIYGVTGMPLAGKTAVAEIMNKKGYELVDMGDVVRKEMKKHDIPAEETGRFVSQQREEKGMDAIAQLTTPYIEASDSDKLVITGMRGLNEKNRFEEELNEKINMIAVWASPKTRETRREQRNREEDIKGDGFHERDLRELEQGVGKLMALSNYIIVNNGSKMKELEEKVVFKILE